jgi:hypothetical protein
MDVDGLCRISMNFQVSDRSSDGFFGLSPIGVTHGKSKKTCDKH